MPIKFRCNYCRQFLGISRAQAGGVVDCPSCGRTIRVPLLDGSVKPLPNPELNLQDAHLAKALEELAQLDDLLDQDLPVVKPKPQGFASLEDEDGDEENEIPQPIPEPIPIEVPIAPTPIKLAPPTFETDVPQDGDDDIEEQAPQPGGSLVDPPVVDAPPVSKVPAPRRSSFDESLLSELASLAPTPALKPTTDVPESAPRGFSPEPRRQTSTSFAGQSLVVLIVFVSGMLLERFTRFVESLQAPKTNVSTTDGVEVGQSDDLSGRITFQTPEGESRPDRGARIIVLPVERSGTNKLSVTGFRPADTEADAQTAAKGLAEIGGALATANETGRFTLSLPAGSYRILVLSHYQSGSAAVEETMLKQLGAVFEKPTELFGRFKHHYAPLRIKGTGDIWDHVF